MYKRYIDPRLKDRVLWLLQYSRFRDWETSPICDLFARAVAMAAADGDKKFFKQLGRRLEERSTSFVAPRRHTTELAVFLLKHWVSRNGLCLCWFTDKALTQLFKITHGSYERDTVRKARERLGLVQPPRPRLGSVRTDGSRLICS